ncbi:hypothetical protein [Rhizobium laguerreae]|uniref:hypothetical protein n=1 Tax=Rhizobium laguerreae TaxID=1076926 RepID=UPI001C901433|nr:hypothetical protein [Rhizobium laguerreae]MBY3252173.1 hypothetical protein [Rhizobium laguerreae]
MTTTNSLEVIRKGLVGLPATRKGFEGLINALILKATGNRIDAMSSGMQNGLDGITPRQNVGPRRAMQAKKYDKKKLEVNALVSEMRQAAVSHAYVDLWVLAITLPVHGGERATLERHADDLAWGLIILDWNNDGVALPELAVLCASHIEASCTFVTDPSFRKALLAIKRRPDFKAHSEALNKRLGAMDVGFTGASAAARKFYNRLYSDKWAAREVAGASPFLCAESPPVERGDVAQRLNRWWRSDDRDVVLTGLEGMGKTWAALAAVKAITEKSESVLPIFIHRTVAERKKNGLAAIIDRLAAISDLARFSVGTPATFWDRRLRIWADANDDAALTILVVIDGVDELEHPFNWGEWCAPIFTQEWSSLFRVMFTSREDEWRDRISLRGRPVRDEPIEHFSESDRDHFLQSRGVDLDKISKEVLEIARHPRTAFHVTRLKDQVGDVERLTREQLLLMDFKNLGEVKDRSMTDSVFRAVVEKMARQVQSAFASEDAHRETEGGVMTMAENATLHSRSALTFIVSDLVSSGWLKRHHARSTDLMFADDRLPEAVGMALAVELKTVNANQASSSLERFLEPWAADDIIERMLRTCATALIVDDSTPNDLLRSVLEKWYQRPTHFDRGRDDAWRRLHVFRQDLFLDFAEEHANDERWLIPWGLGCLWNDHERAREKVHARLLTWLGTSPLPAQEPGGPTRSWIDRLRARRLLRMSALERCGLGEWRDRIAVETSYHRDAAIVAIRMMSFLPRAPFINLLVEWARCAAYADDQILREHVEILLRDNTVDPVEAVERLREAIGPLANSCVLDKLAAAFLLDATGWPEDAEVARRVSGRLRRLPVFREKAHPFEARLLSERRRVSRGGGILPVHPGPLIAGISQFSADPEIELSDDVLKLLQNAVMALEPRDLLELLADGGQNLSAGLRWTQDRVLALQRDYASMALDHWGVARGSETILKMLPIFTTEERASFAADVLARAGKDPKIAPAALALAIVGLPVLQQFAKLKRIEGLQHSPAIHCVLGSASPEDLSQLVHAIDFKGHPENIVAMLDDVIAVAERSPPATVVFDWSGGLRHRDRSVRDLTAELATHVGGEEAAAQIASTTVRTVTPAILSFKQSNLFAKATDEILRDQCGRLETGVLIELYRTRPNLRETIRPTLLQRLQNGLSINGREEPSEEAYRSDPYAKGLAAFYEDNREAVDDLLCGIWLDDARRSVILGDLGDGYVWPLIASMSKYHPDFVREVWKGCLASHPGLRSNDLEFAPASFLGDLQDLQETILLRCRTDEQLFKAVTELEAAGRTSFVVAFVEDALSSERVLDRARGLVIAGFLDATEEASRLWRYIAGVAYGHGWLSEIRQKSVETFNRAVWMRHWTKKMAREPSEIMAYTAFQLLRGILDQRFRLFCRLPEFRCERGWRAMWLDLLLSDFSDDNRDLERRWLYQAGYGNLIYRAQE